jgi:hypothetical protein
MLAKLKERMAAAAKAQEAFIQSASDHIKQITVTDECREERYDICKSCEHFYSPTSTCKICGCFMSAKTYLSEVECPLKKWIKISEIK